MPEAPKFTFRHGRDNPHTIYVAPAGVPPRDPGEIFIGSLHTPRATALAVAGMNAACCTRCTIGCSVCTWVGATCTCRYHRSPAGDCRCTECEDGHA